LVRDFENFNFLHLELQRSREKRISIQSGVVGVTAAEESATSSAYVGAIANTDVTEVGTALARTIDCLLPFLCLQPKSPRGAVVRILQREKETPETHVGLETVGGIKEIWLWSRFPTRRSETAEDVPVGVQNESQRSPVPVTAVVKVASTETVASAAPQKSEFFRLEILKERR
jgi:hypothetical protein